MSEPTPTAQGEGAPSLPGVGDGPRGNQSPTLREGGAAAAFFDVDGTLVKTTIIHYYMYFKRRAMPPLVSAMWQAGFAIKCGYYFLLDKRSRSKLNIVFYRNYGGMCVAEVKALAAGCYRDVIAPRSYPQAAADIAAHQAAGRRVVLVTGSIDFIVKPLADELGVDDLLAPSLVTSNGRFTGELDGPPIGEEEKARRVRRFADAHGIDLSRSHAYGDSIADLPMLEAVGFPHVVNPDKALAARASARGWPVHRWTVARVEGERHL